LNRQDRTDKGGGVATFINESLQPKTLSALGLQTKYRNDDIEVTVDLIEAKGPLQKVVILGVYRPPSSKVGWFNTAKDLILETLSYGSTIIMGDINADLFKPQVYPGKALLEVLSLAGT